MRLIDADALDSKIESHYKHKKIDRYDHDLLGHYIDEEMAPTIGGWVRINDRLPERQEPVIVYVPPYSDEDEEYVGHVAVAYYTQTGSGGYWAGTDGNVYGAIGIIHEPTHWMPLPEPPKEEYGDER